MLPGEIEAEPSIFLHVSILIQQAYLQQTLDAVRAQTYQASEHIVIDGGSTDGTLDILARAGQGSPIQWSSRIGWESATFVANESEVQHYSFPDGIDIPSGGTFMVTLACVAANGTLDVTMTAQEFTP